MAHFSNTKSRKSNWKNKFSPTEATAISINRSSLPTTESQQSFATKQIRSNQKSVNSSKYLPQKSATFSIEQRTTLEIKTNNNHLDSNPKPSDIFIFSKNKTSNGNFSLGNESFMRIDEESMVRQGSIGRPEILAITLGGLLLFWLLLAIIVLYMARLKRSKNKNCFAKIAASEASKTNRIIDVSADDRHRKALDLTSAMPNDESCLILSPSSCTFNLCSPATGIYPGLNNSWVTDDFKSPSTCSMSYPFLGYQRSASEEPAAVRRNDESRNIYDHGDYVEINSIKMDVSAHVKAKQEEVGEEYLTIDRLLKRSTFDGSSTDGTTRTNVSSLLTDQTLKKQSRDFNGKRESAFSEYYLQSGAMNLSLRTLEADPNYNLGSHGFLRQAVMNSGPRKIPTMGSSISLQRKGVPALVSPTSTHLSSSLSQFADAADKSKVTTPNFETNFETLPGGTLFTTQALMTRMSKDRRMDDCPPLPPRKIRREMSPPLISPRLISPTDKHYRSIQINQNQGQTGPQQKSSYYADSRCRSSVQFEFKQRTRNLDLNNLTPQFQQKSVVENSHPAVEAQPSSRKLCKKILSQSFDKPRQPIMGQTRLAERNKFEQNATVASMNQQLIQQQQKQQQPLDGCAYSAQQQQQQCDANQANENIPQNNQLQKVKRPDKIFSTSTPTLPKRQSHRECRTEILQRRWFKYPQNSDINIHHQQQQQQHQQQYISHNNQVLENDACENNAEESIWKYNRLNNINSPDDESRLDKHHYKSKM